jgi:glycosyltransferase involved in cell wall biosynthesis
MSPNEANQSPDARRLRISVLSQMDPIFARTHSIAAFRLCAGLAAQGHLVELVVPGIKRPSPPASELFVTYNLEPNFDVRYLRVGPGDDGYDPWMLRRLVARHGLDAVAGRQPKVVISDGIRLVLPHIVAARMGASHLLTAPWLHEFRDTRLERFACRHAGCVLATNTAILQDLEKQGVSNLRSFVTGNPVPRERVEFGQKCSKADARRRLGLDLRQPVIAYTGKLYLGMKELDYLLEAARRLPECLFLFTGGQPPVIEKLTAQLRQRGIENVRLAGILDNPDETRFYQQAADVLVTYYSLEDLPYAYHHIPSKLAEYMTTGNPIVAADFPGVRDLLNRGNAILAKPHDVDAFVDALAFAIHHADEAAVLAVRAQRDIAQRTSESVGAELSGFLTKLRTGTGTPWSQPQAVSTPER